MNKNIFNYKHDIELQGPCQVGGGGEELQVKYLQNMVFLSKFSTNPYFDSHLSKNINTWTIGARPVGLAFTP